MAAFLREEPFHTTPRSPHPHPLASLNLLTYGPRCLAMLAAVPEREAMTTSAYMRSLDVLFCVCAVCCVTDEGIQMLPWRASYGPARFKK